MQSLALRHFSAIGLVEGKAHIVSFLWHTWNFFDREQSSKVLKEALLLLLYLLLLAGNHSEKNKKCSKWNKKCSQSHWSKENKQCFKGNRNCALGTKNYHLSQNEVDKGLMAAKCYLLWHIMVLNCPVRHYCMALCGFYGVICNIVSFYGLFSRS